MDDGLKQRLIGAIVLVTSAVIFIPMIFDENEAEPEAILLKLPASPEFLQTQIAPPTRPELTVSPLVQQPPPDINKVAPENHIEKPTADVREQSQVEGWVIQMGAFKEQQNAESLRDKLRVARHKAFIQHRPDDTPALYRVYVGPEIQLTEIELLRNELLKQDYKLDDIKIVRYMPRRSL